MIVLASNLRKPVAAVLASLFLLGTSFCISQTQAPKENFHQLLAKAQSGDPDAEYRLGLLYHRGSPETPKDETKATEWFRRSAEKGDPKGENALGIAYMQGDGVAKDDKASFDWVYKSALQGNPKGEAALWVFYHRGAGTPKNESEGLHWLVSSAQNGYPAAQVALCAFYQSHMLVGTDPTMAYAWCLIARTTDTEQAATVGRELSKAKSVLTPSQLVEAKMLASSWNANHKSGGVMPLHSRSFLSTASPSPEASDSLIKSLLTPPPAMGGHTRSGGCETGHWVDSVMSDGEIVKLEDGSVWQVDSGDTVDSGLWLETEEITVCDGKLINTDDDSSVGAHKLK
jgi:hypothetical protein